jgi:hypothetical protein
MTLKIKFHNKKDIVTLILATAVILIMKTTMKTARKKRLKIKAMKTKNNKRRPLKKKQRNT